VVRDGTVFFGADDGVAGQEPWRSDGTVEGTVRIKDIVLGPEGSGALPMSTWEGRIALGASTPDNPLTPRLWLSDGTEEGTVLMREDGTGGTPYEPSNFAQVGSRLLFRASTVEGGHELWGLEPRP
jgi:ELWxxDGT repeat protein